MRQDAWTPEDDTYLATITLRHIKEGSTQLAAFEEVAKLLKRTSAACGYRWNANVRKLHLEAIETAKRTRKEFREEGSSDLTDQDGHLANVQTTLTWSGVLRFLRAQRQESQNLHYKIKQLEQEIEIANMETKRISEENVQLEDKIRKMAEEYQVISDDYKSLLGIVERARLRGLQEG